MYHFERAYFGNEQCCSVDLNGYAPSIANDVSQQQEVVIRIPFNFRSCRVL